MNPLHYPSLERCKKLTEIGFPNSQYRQVSGLCGTKGEKIFSIKDCYVNNDIIIYHCPSIAEMLDVIPKSIPYGDNNQGLLWFSIMRCPIDRYSVYYSNEYFDYVTHEFPNETLPNALADLILHLLSLGYRFEEGRLIK